MFFFAVIFIFSFVVVDFLLNDTGPSENHKKKTKDPKSCSEFNGIFEICLYDIDAPLQISYT